MKVDYLPTQFCDFPWQPGSHYRFWWGWRPGTIFDPSRPPGLAYRLLRLQRLGRNTAGFSTNGVTPISWIVHKMEDPMKMMKFMNWVVF